MAAKHGDVEKLRADGDELAGLGLDEIVEHYETLIRALGQPPVLIGHSFGGLIVEYLLGTEYRTITPAAQRLMAERAGELIEEAAAATSQLAVATALVRATPQAVRTSW